MKTQHCQLEKESFLKKKNINIGGLNIFQFQNLL